MYNQVANRHCDSLADSSTVVRQEGQQDGLNLGLLFQGNLTSKSSQQFSQDVQCVHLHFE